MGIGVTFAAVAVGLAVLLYATAVLLQSALYESPVPRMPFRALGAGLVAAAFLTYWVHLNTRAEYKDKFGTFFEFNSTQTKQLETFTTLRRMVTVKDAEGKPAERKSGVFSKVGSNYLENKDPTKILKLATADYVTVALEVPDGDKGDKPAVFEAELFVDVEGKPGEMRPVPAGEPRADVKYSRETVRYFREAGGRRYIEFNQLGTPGSIQMPSRGAFLGAIILNLAHYAVWLAVFWLVLRFGFGPALGLAAVFGTLTMLFVLPILFDRNKAGVQPPAAAAQVMTAHATV